MIVNRKRKAWQASLSVGNVVIIVYPKRGRDEIISKGSNY